MRAPFCNVQGLSREVLKSPAVPRRDHRYLLALAKDPNHISSLSNLGFIYLGGDNGAAPTQKEREAGRLAPTKKEREAGYRLLAHAGRLGEIQIKLSPARTSLPACAKVGLPFRNELDEQGQCSHDTRCDPRHPRLTGA